MRRFLATVGALALAGWTILGLVAWSSATRGWRITVASTSAGRDDAPDRAVLELRDELGMLRDDVRALASALGESLPALRDELGTRQDDHAAALARRIDAWSERLAAREATSEVTALARAIELQRQAIARLAPPPSEGDVERLAAPASEHDAPRHEADVGDERHAGASETVALPPPQEPATSTAPDLEASSPATPDAPITSSPRPRASFLAFHLPSDDVRFDERREWAVLPSLSRVGFDAKTTLHDFTATTSAIEGELVLAPGRPAEEPELALRVDARRLASGEGARDEGMHARLDVERHRWLSFTLTRFEPDEIVPSERRGAGTAHGELTIHGRTRTVAMPVRYSIDDSRRLCVEGDVPLDVSLYDVEAPSKLGLVTMQREVNVWISLRFRALPRADR